MTAWDEVWELLEKYRNPDGTYRECRFFDPVDEAFIKRAEAALGHAFAKHGLPKEYRLFVKAYGSGSMLGLEVYGLFQGDNEPNTFGAAVDFTLEARANDSLPNHYLIIRNAGLGDYDVLDVDGPVYRVFTDEKLEDKWMAGSFGEYLLNELEALEDAHAAADAMLVTRDTSA